MTQLCTAEFLVSDSQGFGFSRSWLPSIVAERFVASTRDGSVDRAPDAVPFIDADLVWTNEFTDPVHLSLSLHRASRSFVESSPNTLALDDALSWDIGATPNAPLPTAVRNGVGTRLKRQRFSNSTIFYGRSFADYDDFVSYHDIGLIEPAETVQVRYRCLFSTPGEWRVPLSPRHEVFARWARLRLWSAPWIAGAI